MMKKLFITVLITAMVLSVQSLALAAMIIPDDQVVGAFDVDTSAALMLDVRKDMTVAQDGAKIEGSIRIPLDTLLDSMDLPEDKNAAIIVYSQNGSAGEMAVMALTKLGYTNVKNLDGGIDSWKMMGFSTAPVDLKVNAPVAGGC